MPRDLPIGNGTLLAAFDFDYRIRDFYFPRVGKENHALGYPLPGAGSLQRPRSPGHPAPGKARRPGAGRAHAGHDRLRGEPGNPPRSRVRRLAHHHGYRPVHAGGAHPGHRGRRHPPPSGRKSPTRRGSSCCPSSPWARRRTDPVGHKCPTWVAASGRSPPWRRAMRAGSPAPGCPCEYFCDGYYVHDTHPCRAGSWPTTTRI